MALGACGFDHGRLPSDGPPPDIEPDVVMPTWAVDGTSKKGVPATAVEWNELLSANGLGVPPTHLWLMQESSGALADSIGTISLTAHNTPTYRNAVTGWARAGVGTDDTVADEGFLTNSIGNLNGSSYLMLVYVALA